MTPPYPSSGPSPPPRRLWQLDGIRGATAIYVVLHHWAGSSSTIPVWLHKGLLSFGQEAVIIFFLLSGFVIGWSSLGRSQQTFYQYFIRRFRRIYFPFLVSLLLVFAITVSNQGWSTVIEKPGLLTTLLGNLLMLQELTVLKPGVWVDPFLGNLSIWTLTYEWWFYFLFFPAYKYLIHRPWRVVFITLFSLTNFLIYTQFPNVVSLVFSYFALWWSGVEVALIVYRKRLSWSSLSPSLASVAAMVAVTAGPVLSSDQIRLGYYPFLTFRHCVAVAVFLVLAKLWHDKRPGFMDFVLKPFKIFAPISYAIYLFHYPILVIWKPTLWDGNPWIIMPLKLVILMGLSYGVEVYLQPKVNRIIR